METLLDVCDTIVREESIDDGLMDALKNAIIAMSHFFVQSDLVKAQ